MTSLDLAYAAVATTTAGLLVYVMQKTEHDRINRVDPARLQWIRRLAFIFTALAVLYSIFSTDWQMACLILVGSGGTVLFINAVALSLRAPPANGSRMRNALFSPSRFVARLISYFSAER